MIPISDSGKLYIKKLQRLAVRFFGPERGNVHKQHSCGDKVRYSKESATRAAIRMKDRTGDEFDAYECQYCKRWHIGHSLFATITVWRQVASQADDE